MQKLLLAVWDEINLNFGLVCFTFLPLIVFSITKSLFIFAKINKDFVIEKTISGKKVKQTKPKFKFISSHTARRSFCTNAYDDGVPPYQIMVISGHKSEKVFNNYIKTSVKRKATLVAQHPFFD